MRFFGSCSRKIASHLARATRAPSSTASGSSPREREDVVGFDAPVHGALFPLPSFSYRMPALPFKWPLVRFQALALSRGQNAPAGSV
jgi:hypothetical protein